MLYINNIPDSSEGLNRYEVENMFHSWSFQPAQSPIDLDIDIKYLKNSKYTGRKD